MQKSKFLTIGQVKERIFKMNITTYTLQDGQEKYRCRGYLGIDDLTGIQVDYDRRGFDSEEEAERDFWKAKLEFEEIGKKKKAKAFTFQEVYEQWLEQYRLNVKEGTFFKVRRIFELNILPEFGRMIISKIKPFVIQKKLNEWHEQFVVYRKYYTYLKMVFKYAFIHDYIHENPCDKVIIPTKKQKFKKDEYNNFYNKHELEEVLSIIKENESLKWYAVFRLLAFTGLRRGELLALTWSDIDFTRQTLDVNKSLGEKDKYELYVTTPKNISSIRNITLDPITVSVLKKWKAEQAEFLMARGFNALNKNQLLFSKHNTNGHLNLSSCNNALIRMSEKYGFRKIGIHGFRHTHCSLLFEAGVPMKDVMERLGHSDIQTTMNIYTHVTEQSRDKSAEKFASYVGF